MTTAHVPCSQSHTKYVQQYIKLCYFCLTIVKSRSSVNRWNLSIICGFPNTVPLPGGYIELLRALTLNLPPFLLTRVFVALLCRSSLRTHCVAFRSAFEVRAQQPWSPLTMNWVKKPFAFDFVPLLQALSSFGLHDRSGGRFALLWVLLPPDARHLRTTSRLLRCVSSTRHFVDFVQLPRYCCGDRSVLMRLAGHAAHVEINVQSVNFIWHNLHWKDVLEIQKKDGGVVLKL